MKNNDNINNRIHILPDYIANQIAAGEVVQRPESVIKELVENSLDADADSIGVIVRGAGKNLIHIIDNGAGMSRPDLELSIKRHATSKIKTTDDLENILTFGFRGEALASISSVAFLEIRTKQNNDSSDFGWRIVSEPLKPEIIEQCSTDAGTQIFVKNLFFNVPARRKFLKSNLTEFRYISDTMLKFALSNPNIRFTFYDDDTLIFDLMPATLEQRIVDTMGKKTVDSLIPVHSENELLKISGFIGQPHLAKQTYAGQYFFLNGRSIQSRTLSHAVFSAFEHLLEKNKHPLFIINLTIDPKKVDVNVHPQKHEVKFDDERFIYSCINKAVNSALIQNNIIPEIQLREQNSLNPFESHNFPHGSKDGEFLMVNKETGEIIDTSLQTNMPRQVQNLSSFSKPSQRFDFSDRNPYQDRARLPELSAFEALFGKNEKKETIEPQPMRKEEEHFSDKPTNMYWQVHNKYIITQTEAGIMMIDQHAAHERVLYERAIRAMNREFANSQDLLFSIRIKLSPSQYSLIKELEADLLNLGYTFNLSNNLEIELNSVPLDLKAGEEETALRGMLDEFEENEKIRHTDKRDNIAATYSCKAAIKTGDKLSQEEMKFLINTLFKCDMPYVCPHGRPVVLEFTIPELDKHFKRT